MSGGPRVAVLGANGLIGHRIALDLLAVDFGVLAIGRSFAPAQEAALERADLLNTGTVDRSLEDLARILNDGQVDVVVNAIGVLQDTRPGESDDVHDAFPGRLLTAIRAVSRPVLLIHISVPGAPEEDATTFSLSKRRGEAALRASGLPVAILRPGFVLARQAYGGSALMRALAMLPFQLPPALATRPFRVTAASDISRTVHAICRRWRNGERDWHVAWNVMSAEPTTLGDVLAGLRRHLGGPRPRMTVPALFLDLGAAAGDLAARLGWRPAVRRTALAELRRGVNGDPRPWMDATGIAPMSLLVALPQEAPASVQELWFARLYLLKALIVSVLVVFWCVSGTIALTVAYQPARGILLTHGFSGALATAITIISSLADISVGMMIAFRRTASTGLVAGVVLSLGYMASAALITPDLWVEPLGALVKTGPAIVLMLVARAVLSAR